MIWILLAVLTNSSDVEEVPMIKKGSWNSLATDSLCSETQFESTTTNNLESCWNFVSVTRTCGDFFAYHQQSQECRCFDSCTQSNSTNWNSYSFWYDEDKPYVNLWRPNGTVPARGKLVWEVQLADLAHFSTDNSSALTLHVYQLCEWDVSFKIERANGDESQTWSLNSSTTSNALYGCDLTHQLYNIGVENPAHQACNVTFSVSVQQHIATCDLEDILWDLLKYIIIALVVGVLLCCCIVLAVICGVCGIICICCQKRPQTTTQYYRSVPEQRTSIRYPNPQEPNQPITPPQQPQTYPYPAPGVQPSGSIQQQQTNPMAYANPPPPAEGTTYV